MGKILLGNIKEPNNVKRYGAVGDGIVDDTKAIQKALDDLMPGSSLYFPDGIYKVSQLKVNTTKTNGTYADTYWTGKRKERVTLYGNGFTSRIMQIENSNADLLRVDNCPRFSIHDLEFESEGGTKGSGLFITKSEFSIIDRVNIRKFPECGINIEAEIIETQFCGNDEVHITNSYIQENKSHGICADSICDLTISMNNIEFNEGNGILLQSELFEGGYPGGNHIISQNNILTNSLHGLEVTNNTRSVMDSNQIRYNGRIGVRIVGGKQYVFNGNDVHVNGRLFPCEAVVVAYTNNVIISNNIITCRDFPITQTAAFWFSNVSNVRVLGNDLTDNGSYANVEASTVEWNHNIGYNGEHSIEGKQLVFLGDSYCVGVGWMHDDNTTDYRGWAYAIQKNNPTSQCINLAYGGYMVTNGPGDPSLSSQLWRQINDYPQCDYIIIEGGINDAAAGKPLGEIITGFDTNGINESTFCGALEALFSNIFYNFHVSGKIKKIGFITPTLITKTPLLDSMMDAAVKICKKWSIPCLDLYHEGGLCVDTGGVYLKLINSTAHPNKLAYEICFNPKIEAWIKSL